LALQRGERFSVSFVVGINPSKRSSPHAPTAHRTSACACTNLSATTALPAIGYALIVDGQVKTEFKTQDHALKAARELKGRLPMLQVKIYDAESKRSEEMELTAA
jgi:PP-loop superfamily ATP-utilizing enzyme